jgi:hypothetical protein
MDATDGYILQVSAKKDPSRCPPVWKRSQSFFGRVSSPVVPMWARGHGELEWHLVMFKAGELVHTLCDVGVEEHTLATYDMDVFPSGNGQPPQSHRCRLCNQFGKYVDRAMEVSDGR